MFAPRPRARRGGAVPRHAAGQHGRHGELDAGGLQRARVRDDERVRAAPGRSARARSSGAPRRRCASASTASRARSRSTAGTVPLEFESVDALVAFFENAGPQVAAKQALGPELYDEARRRFREIVGRVQPGRRRLASGSRASTCSSSPGSAADRAKLLIEYDGPALRGLGAAGRAADDSGRDGGGARDGPRRAGRADRRRADRRRRPRARPGREPRRRAAAARRLERQPARRRPRARERAGARRLRRPPRRRVALLRVPRLHARARCRRSSAGGRCTGRSRSTATPWTPAPRSCPASTTSPPSRPPRPSTCCFERNISYAEWADAGEHVLEFRIEAPSFMRNQVRILVGHDARGGPGPAQRRRLPRAVRGPAAQRGGGDRAATRSLPCTSEVRRREGPAHKRRRHPGHRPEPHAPGAARAARHRARGDRARLEPQRHRAQHHDPPAAVGRGDRVRRRHDRLRHRRHAGGLRPLRGARPGRSSSPS